MSRRPLVLAAFAILAACNPKAPTTASPSPSLEPNVMPTPVSLRVSGHGTKTRPVRFIETKENRKQFEILTHSFQSKGAAGTATLVYNDVNINFFGKDGSVLSATAPQAGFCCRALRTRVGQRRRPHPR